MGRAPDSIQTFCAARGVYALLNVCGVSAKHSHRGAPVGWKRSERGVCPVRLGAMPVRPGDRPEGGPPTSAPVGAAPSPRPRLATGATAVCPGEVVSAKRCRCGLMAGRRRSERGECPVLSGRRAAGGSAAALEDARSRRGRRSHIFSSDSHHAPASSGSHRPSGA